MSKHFCLYFLILLTSCGTLVTSTTQKIYLNIVPEVEDIKIFTTNFKELKVNENGAIVIRKNKDGTILTIKKPGYFDSTIFLSTNINIEVFVLDSILTLGIGLIFDNRSGLLYKYDNSTVRIVLTKKE